MKVVKGGNMRGGWTGEAVFSNCGRFRYSLLRRWNNAGNAKLINASCGNRLVLGRARA
jgi:hypothetical protein